MEAFLTQLWTALGAGTSQFVAAAFAAILPVISNPYVLISGPAIYGGMYAWKQLTPFIKRSKYDKIIYRLSTVGMGILYAFVLIWIRRFTKCDWHYGEAAIIGAILGALNIPVFHFIIWVVNRNKKKKEEKANA